VHWSYSIEHQSFFFETQCTNPGKQVLFFPQVKHETSTLDGTTVIPYLMTLLQEQWVSVFSSWISWSSIVFCWWLAPCYKWALVVETPADWLLPAGNHILNLHALTSDLDTDITLYHPDSTSCLNYRCENVFFLFFILVTFLTFFYFLNILFIKTNMTGGYRSVSSAGIKDWSQNKTEALYQNWQLLKQDKKTSKTVLQQNKTL